MASAQYLAEHLAEVPAIVIPTIIGRHDGNGRPGLFDSVIQAAWSFCLALRARGLGTTWVTAVLERGGAGQGAARHPRAHDRDRPAPRGVDQGHRVRHERRGTRRARSPTSTGSGRPSSADRGRRCASRTVRGRSPRSTSPPRRAVLWSLISDIEVATRFSTESQGAEWQGTERGLGAQFTGRNRHDIAGEWELPCTVDVYDEPTSFGWRTSDPERPGARWRFDLQPPATGRGCGSATPWARVRRERRRRSGRTGQGSAHPAPPPRRGAGQHATHHRRHQGTRRAVTDMSAD